MRKHFFLLFLTLTAFTCQVSAQTSTDSSTTAKPEKTPEFKNGLSGWTKFLEKNLDQYFILDENIPPGKYKVVASFLVDIDGSVKDIKIEEDPGHGTANEMKRILKLSSKQWVPAYDKGQPVPYRHRQSLTLTK